jgi:hypothetical protein
MSHSAKVTKFLSTQLIIYNQTKLKINRYETKTYSECLSRILNNHNSKETERILNTNIIIFSFL